VYPLVYYCTDDRKAIQKVSSSILVFESSSMMATYVSKIKAI